MATPLPAEQLAALCAEIDRDLRRLVAARGAGQLSEPEFVQAILSIEHEQATGHGLTLTASHTYDDWTVISVRLPGCSDPCAAFEFHPISGQNRALGTACRCCDPRSSERSPEI